MTRRKRELYVEGGGDRNPSLATELRKAFNKLFERDGNRGKPKVIACGGRKAAYDQFCTALETGEAEVALLVDAEEVVSSQAPERPWEHVRQRRGDGWNRPPGATDEQLHLMAVCMETWLLADRAALKAVFGPQLDEGKLPTADGSLEARPKDAIYSALAAATRNTKAGTYGKGKHSFKVLAAVDPAKLRALSWAKRFLDHMGRA